MIETPPAQRFTLLEHEGYVSLGDRTTTVEVMVFDNDYSRVIWSSLRHNRNPKRGGVLLSYGAAYAYALRYCHDLNEWALTA